MLWLAKPDDGIERRFITRFDARFWSVNFPRPMMAALTNPGGDTLDVTLVFYAKNDLAGLIWESEDRLDHPLLRYATRRDYRGVVLQFRWTSQNIRPLPDLDGPTLTIEGRDQAGLPRTWFVRLWNFASGSPEDAIITLDFDALSGGFLLPSEADPVWAGDIDRMFISMVPPGFDAGDNGALPGGRVEALVRLSEMRTTGGHAELAIADDYVKPHSIRLANGYDDSFNISPARLLRNLVQLGYRDWFTHYVGMSHYYNLALNSAEQRFVVDLSAPALNVATRAWHADFFTRLARFRYRLALSLSFELLAQNAPLAWAQRAHDGKIALTGWEPPSTLLAPTNSEATGYLKSVLEAFGEMMIDAGLDPVFQIGEPWWWVTFIAAGPAPNDTSMAREPHFYDGITTSLFSAETGLPLPPKHVLASEIPTPDQQVYLDWLGDKLGLATLDIRDFLKARFPGAQVTLLFFTPQVLNDSEPMLATTNFPVTHWRYPAFDFLQIEDYDHVIDGNWAAHERGLAQVLDGLGYPLGRTQYFAGFVLLPENLQIWRNIELALGDAARRGFAERVVWAWPQVIRDGTVLFEIEEEEELTGFHDVRLPEMISFGSTGGPRFSTQIVVTASGHERRNRDWAEARADYDIAPGIRSEADLAGLIAFFRARAGRAFGFRFKDWTDFRSAAPGAPVTPFDQPLVRLAGATTDFGLVKVYGANGQAHVRNITKPVAVTVRVGLDGIETTSGWSVDTTTGRIAFTTPPPDEAVLTAGFEFDVPVRFAEDRLVISLEAFAAGAVPAIRLVEIRPAGEEFL